MIDNDRYLYEIIKTYVPAGYKTYYDLIKREFKDAEGIVTNLNNLVTIEISPADSSDRLQNGIYTKHSRIVDFVILTDIGGADKVDDGFRAGNTIIAGMDNLININGIINSIRLTEVRHNGLTDQGVHIFTIKYKIIYN